MTPPCSLILNFEPKVMKQFGEQIRCTYVSLLQLL